MLYFKKGYKFYNDAKDNDSYNWLLKSANLGNASAMEYIGYLYEDSAWQYRNNDSAQAWLGYAVKNNNLEPLNDYAVTYLNKPYYSGTPNYDTAYDLLNRARQYKPQLGNIYTNLGLIFESGGSRVRANTDSAIYYYRIAAQKGRQKAKDALKRLGVSDY